MSEVMVYDEIWVSYAQMKEGYFTWTMKKKMIIIERIIERQKIPF